MWQNQIDKLLSGNINSGPNPERLDHSPELCAQNSDFFDGLKWISYIGGGVLMGCIGAGKDMGLLREQFSMYALLASGAATIAGLWVSGANCDMWKSEAARATQFVDLRRQAHDGAIEYTISLKSEIAQDSRRPDSEREKAADIRDLATAVAAGLCWHRSK